MQLVGTMQDLKDTSAGLEHQLQYRQDTLQHLNLCWMLLFRQLKQALSSLAVMGADMLRTQRHLIRLSQFQHQPLTSVASACDPVPCPRLSKVGKWQNTSMWSFCNLRRSTQYSQRCLRQAYIWPVELRYKCL